MHPDATALAAYLDGLGSDDERAGLRAHILTCAACAARLERLRADARLISDTLAAARPSPDVRAAVRARRRRSSPAAWLGRGIGVAGALAALLLFAILLGAGGTAGRMPDRLFVTDRRGGQVVALDARGGTRLAAAQVGNEPTSIRYDAARDRLYVMLRDAVVGVDPRTLQVLDRWTAPQPLGGRQGLALDAQHGRLYVAQPGGLAVLALGTPGLALVDTIALGAAPAGLATAPDGKTLYALVPEQARLWTIALGGNTPRSSSLALAEPDARSLGWLAMSRDGAAIYVLLAGAGGRPTIWRVDTAGRVVAATRLAELPPPWDLEVLDTGQLAIPRGDGATGGVELVDGGTLATSARLDPQRDQHHLAVGPGGAAFGLNFTSDSVTRFDTRQHTIVWRTPERADWQPWDAVYVSGGWRWPF